MKNIVIIYTLFLTSFSWSQNYNSGTHKITSPYSIEECSNRINNKLKGDVFSVDTKGFYVPVPKEDIDSIINANTDRPGPFYHRKQYFDSLGREIKTIHISNNYGVEYKYDSLGHLSNIFTLIGEYNRNTGEGRYGEYFSIDYEAILEWKTRGNIVIGTAISNIKKDSIVHTKKDSIVYTLDENKNITRIESYFDNKKQPVYEFYYDSLNRIISSKYYNKKEIEIYNWTYVYNDEGLLQNSVKKDTNGIVLETMLFKYDLSGSKIYSEIKSGGQLLHLSQNEYEYEYDNNGNWILSTTKQNGKVVRMSFREIKYFEN